MQRIDSYIPLYWTKFLLQEVRKWLWNDHNYRNILQLTKYYWEKSTNAIIYRKLNQLRIMWLVKRIVNISCNNLLYKVSTWKSTNIAIQPKLPLETTTRFNLHRCVEKLIRRVKEGGGRGRGSHCYFIFPRDWLGLISSSSQYSAVNEM